MSNSRTSVVPEHILIISCHWEHLGTEGTSKGPTNVCQPSLCLRRSFHPELAWALEAPFIQRSPGSDVYPSGADWKYECTSQRARYLEANRMCVQNSEDGKYWRGSGSERSQSRKGALVIACVGFALSFPRSSAPGCTVCTQTSTLSSHMLSYLCKTSGANLHT